MSEQKLQENGPGFAIDGFAEACVSVQRLEERAAQWAQPFGWVADAPSPVPEAELRLWGLPATASARQMRLRNPQVDAGAMRLIEYSGCAQSYTRANDHSWDTGGIFDLNARAKDLRALAAELMAQDWHGNVEPHEFQFGPVRVVEWIARGPGQVYFAISQRLDPPLQGDYHLNPVSCLFNSTQIVANMDQARHFYCKLLGFHQFIDWDGTAEEPVANVLGLPHNIYAGEMRRLYILSPQPELRQGTVELLSYGSLVGEDFSASAMPPNLGITTLRFPVQGLDALKSHLQQAELPGVSALYGPVDSEIDPWGAVRLLGVRSPEGACLEFFEKL